MGYSNYKNLKQVTKKFGLKTKKVDLFPNIKYVEPTNWLKKTIELAYHVALTNEKVKSERLISPILTEIHETFKDKIALFSGEELNVEPQSDLNGPCDFFFSANPDSYLLEAPIVTLAEAKNEDIDYGIAQCTAQMIGASKFNEQSDEAIDVIWGCTTTAGEWKFLKLVGATLYIDEKSYSVNNLQELLGVFREIFQQI